MGEELRLGRLDQQESRRLPVRLAAHRSTADTLCGTETLAIFDY